MSTREEIAAGPKWGPLDRETAPEVKVPQALFCDACTELTYVDARTGLCRPCWRVWRFSEARRPRCPICGDLTPECAAKAAVLGPHP